MDNNTIRHIKASVLPNLELVKVAAYVRVSADTEDMEHSYSQQISYFNNYITRHIGWEFAGIYADKGISGTLNNRPEFMRMMEDARKHKFDRLITKSVSRFARNTLTLLQSVRELTALGIDVYFEKENLHSISPDGELMLTLIATYAEEEARNTSENVKWRIKKKFENGEPTHTRIYGYRWVDNNFVVAPEEAKVVRKIFDLYLSGMGRLRIAKFLNASPEYDKYKNRPWRENHIAEILRNEKYTGDLLLQKTYTPDFRTKRKRKNTGQVPHYLVKNNHEPIIAPEIFAEVQEEIQRRSKLVPSRKISESELFRGLIRCKCCNFKYIRRHRRYDHNKYFWVCNGYKIYGKDFCQNKEIREEILMEKTREVLNLPIGYPLTDKIIKDNIKLIEAHEGNKLRLYLTNGKIETITWQTPSRSESWTKGMKERARRDGGRGHEKRRAQLLQSPKS